MFERIFFWLSACLSPRATLTDLSTTPPQKYLQSFVFFYLFIFIEHWLFNTPPIGPDVPNSSHKTRRARFGFAVCQIFLLLGLPADPDPNIQAGELIPPRIFPPFPMTGFAF